MQPIYLMPDGPDLQSPKQKKEAIGLFDRAEAGWYQSGAEVDLTEDGELRKAGEGDRTIGAHTFSREEDLTGYYPENQTWVGPDELRLPEDGPDWWLGWPEGSPPEPEELRRPEAIGGYPVEMGDGNTWHVPPARRWDGSPGALPATLTVGPGGEEQRQVKPEYRDILEEVEEIADDWYELFRLQREGKDDVELTLQSVPLDVMIRMLALNYRIGRPEVNALGLITTSNRMQISTAVLDVGAYLQMNTDVEKKPEAKKKDGPSGASPSPTAGGGDGQK
jgi:hypothetical protein